MHSSQYVTNQFDVRIPVRGLHTNLKRLLVTKFFNSSIRWRSRSSLVTKPYGVQTRQLLEEKDELGHMSLVHNMLVKNFCIEVHQLWRLLKQFLYMFSWGCEKRKPKHLYTNWSEIKPKKLIFLNLDRYFIYRATVEHRV